MQEYEKFLTGLNKADVVYTLVGAFAVGLNGFIRATQDVDILVENSPENLTKLIHYLENYGQGHAKGLQIQDFSDEEGCISVIEDFPIDIFTQMNSKKYKDFLPHIIQSPIGNEKVPHLDAQALIELKKDSWREKDKIDATELKKRI